ASDRMIRTGSIHFLLFLVLVFLAPSSRAREFAWFVMLRHNNEGAAAFRQANYREAERLLSAAVKEAEQYGPEYEGQATPLSNLGALYEKQGRYAESEPLYKRSLAIREKALGPDHPDVAVILTSLAELYYAQGKYAEAEQLFKRALPIHENAPGPNAPDLAIDLNKLAHAGVVGILNNLAALYTKQGKYGEAESQYKRALAIIEKGLGPNHPNVAPALENYAISLRQTGRAAEAAELEDRAKAIKANLP